MMCPILFEVEKMKKLRMTAQNSLTLEEGCNKYLDNCRSRNLREGTINHYKQSYEPRIFRGSCFLKAKFVTIVQFVTFVFVKTVVFWCMVDFLIISIDKTQ